MGATGMRQFVRLMLVMAISQSSNRRETTGVPGMVIMILVKVLLLLMLMLILISRASNGRERANLPGMTTRSVLLLVMGYGRHSYHGSLGASKPMADVIMKRIGECMMHISIAGFL